MIQLIHKRTIPRKHWQFPRYKGTSRGAGEAASVLRFEHPQPFRAIFPFFGRRLYFRKKLIIFFSGKKNLYVLTAKMNWPESFKFFCNPQEGSGLICPPLVLMRLSSRSPRRVDSWLWHANFPFWSLSFANGGKFRNLQVRRIFSINIMFFIIQFSGVSYSCLPDSAVVKGWSLGGVLRFWAPIKMYFITKLNVC